MARLIRPLTIQYLHVWADRHDHVKIGCWWEWKMHGDLDKNSFPSQNFPKIGTVGLLLSDSRAPLSFSFHKCWSSITLLVCFLKPSKRVLFYLSWCMLEKDRTVADEDGANFYFHEEKLCLSHWPQLRRTACSLQMPNSFRRTMTKPLAYQSHTTCFWKRN